MNRMHEPRYLTRAVETTIRVGAVLLLAAACLLLVWPFLTLLAWASIIAIAFCPAYRRLEAAVGNRRWLAATLFTVALLGLLILPIVPLLGTIRGGVEAIAQRILQGKLEVPPPPDGVQAWPLIGEPLHAAWAAASKNLASFLASQQDTLKDLARWLLSSAAGLGIAVAELLASVILAGVLLTRAEGAGRMASAVGARLGGLAGKASVELAVGTVRSVARGILGVAAIQSGLAGLGLFLAGIPGWGLLTVLGLFLSVAQLGVAFVMVPTAIYLFFGPSLGVAIAFAIWTAFVSVIDNVLKPILLGRGLDVPMVVIFVGSVGGLLATGIIGLFTGSVVMAVGYRMFLLWLESPPPEEAEAAKGGGDGAASVRP